VKKYIAAGEMIVFCVVFCGPVIALFLLAIVLLALALGDLKTLLALCVQFSIGFNLV
jgi:phage-related minor tail protein